MIGYVLGGVIAGLLIGVVQMIAFYLERDPWGERRWRDLEPTRRLVKKRAQR